MFMCSERGEGKLKIKINFRVEIAKYTSHGPRSFILCAAYGTIKSTPRDSRSSELRAGGSWFMQGNSREHTHGKATSGMQCIAVCILNLGYYLSPCARTRLARSLWPWRARARTNTICQTPEFRQSRAKCGPIRVKIRRTTDGIPRPRESLSIKSDVDFCDVAFISPAVHRKGVESRSGISFRRIAKT